MQKYVPFKNSQLHKSNQMKFPDQCQRVEEVRYKNEMTFLSC